MHACGLVGEVIEHAWLSTQSHPDFMRLPLPPLAQGLLLAGVREAITTRFALPRSIPSQGRKRRTSTSPKDAQSRRGSMMSVVPLREHYWHHHGIDEAFDRSRERGKNTPKNAQETHEMGRTKPGRMAPRTLENQ